MRYSLISSAALVATAVAGDVTVVWQHHTDTDSNSLSVFDSAKGEMIDHACDTSVGNIDFSLVEDDGTGNFTSAGEEFHIHSKPSHSGGPVCLTHYNDRSTVVECSGVPYEGEGVVRRGLSRRSLDECFADESAQSNVRMLRARGIAGPPRTRAPPQNERRIRRARNKRQQGVPPIQHRIKETNLVDDGSPKDWFRHEQMTEGNDCRDGSCSASWTEGESFTIGFTASITPFEWISGGFSVSESRSESRGYSCNGENDEEVCVWYNTHQTGYWVTNVERIGGSVQSESDEFEITSPNDDNAEGGFYCVRGGCGGVGQVDWSEDE